MELVDFIDQQITELETTLRAYEVFDEVEIYHGQHQGRYKEYKKDNILINMLIPSIHSGRSTCKKQLFGTLIAQLKLNFCIRRNPNYELYYDVVEVLKTDTNYIDIMSSEISIEAGRGLITINASKLAIVRL